MTDPDPVPPRPRRRRRSRAPTVVALVVCAAVGLPLVTLGVLGLAGARADTAWVETPLTIVEVVTEPYRYERHSRGAAHGMGLRVRARYTWEVGGRSYEGTRYSNDEAVAELSDMEEGRAFAAHLREDRVIGYRDPEDPSRAVLVRREVVRPAIAFGLGLGLLVFAGALTRRLRRPSPPRAPRS